MQLPIFGSIYAAKSSPVQKIIHILQQTRVSCMQKVERFCKKVDYFHWNFDASPNFFSWCGSELHQAPCLNTQKFINLHYKLYTSIHPFGLPLICYIKKNLHFLLEASNPPQFIYMFAANCAYICIASLQATCNHTENRW